MTTRDKLAFVQQMSRVSLASLRDLQALMRYSQSYRDATRAKDWQKANRMQYKILGLCKDYGFSAYFEDGQVTITTEDGTIAVPTLA